MGGKADSPQSDPENPDAGGSTGRRDFIKIIFTVGVVGVAVGIVSFFTDYLTFIPSVNTQNLSWPKLLVANLSDLTPLTPILFNYPLDDEPNVLVKLGVPAENGIGPDGDIVAFSQICQHLGCIYDFVPKSNSPVCDSSYQMPVSGGYCCCHGSHYDFTKDGAVIGGPAPRPVPMVQLELDQQTGDIYAVAMGPPSIFGHNTGDTAPSAVLADDLTGGTVVAGAITNTTSTGTNSTSASGT